MPRKNKNFEMNLNSLSKNYLNFFNKIKIGDIIKYTYGHTFFIFAVLNKTEIKMIMIYDKYELAFKINGLCLKSNVKQRPLFSKFSIEFPDDKDHFKHFKILKKEGK